MTAAVDRLWGVGTPSASRASLSASLSTLHKKVKAGCLFWEGSLSRLHTKGETGCLFWEGSLSHLHKQGNRAGLPVQGGEPLPPLFECCNVRWPRIGCSLPRAAVMRQPLPLDQIEQMVVRAT